VAEGILDPCQAPAMLFTHWVDLLGAGGDRPLDRKRGILDDQEHSHGAPAQ
jgi:hypothetical protein